jgi:hypothetical protein
MLRILIFLTCLVSSPAFAVLVKKEGISPMSQKPCTVEYELNDKQITHFMYFGTVEIWEIIAETDDGYGPDLDLVDEYLFGELETVTLDVTKKFLSSDYSIKGKISAPDVPAHMAITGTIQGTPENPSALELKMAAKMSLFTLGYNSFSCEFGPEA